ncbi:hypothetical protein H6800_00590 [Candidatus Nomurabacteria bacterium]|nr:hypothetical protein [Candidatus Nomurabacteria bacterium]
MKRCPYNGDPEKPCAVPEDWENILYNSCNDGEYGRNCAAIMSQMIVLGSTGREGIRSCFDELYGEIIGHYSPKTISVSEAPDHLQEDVVKCRLPVREKRPMIEGGVAIHHVDLMCTLLNNEMLVASNWYENRRNQLTTRDTAINWWIFAESDGEIDLLLEPIDTVSQYDQSFHPGSAVLHNAFNPPLMIVEILRRRAKVD